MAPKPAAKQKALTSAGFWPMLPKTQIAVGKYASVVGKYWTGCPADDTLKRFLCIVNEFALIHYLRHTFPLHSLHRLQADRLAPPARG